MTGSLLHLAERYMVLIIFRTIRSMAFHPFLATLVNKKSCQLQISRLTGTPVQLNQCHLNPRMAAGTLSFTRSKNRINMVGKTTGNI